MSFKIDTDKLVQVLSKLDAVVHGAYAEQSIFIGSINGKPIRITVMGEQKAIGDENFPLSVIAENIAVIKN